MSYMFILPDIGEGLHEAEIVTWFVKTGDFVKENQNIVEVQTDKAVVELPSPYTGIVESLGAEEGEIVKVGEPLIRFQIENGSNSKASCGQEKEDLHFENSVSSIHTSAKVSNRVIAAPGVRKLARTLGVDLINVTPSAKGGRVTAGDVTAFKERLDQTNEAVSTIEKPVDKRLPIEFPETEKRVRIKGIRKKIFENMKRSQLAAAQCTGMEEINVTRLVEARKRILPYAEKKGIKMTYLPFIIKAVAKTLTQIPVFNSSVDEENMEIIYHPSIHIGIATATQAGLIVPVLKNADQKSIFEMAMELERLTNKAHSKQLTAEELTGSTFTISNTGSKGGFFATPIINYPEAAILGVHSIKKKPVVEDDQIIIGEMMGMSLTFDHRIIDGEPAGIFISTFAEYLQVPELLM
ncbi:2-oxo acid dehydrogenase subunit E2 [Peribacillus cavernae]|uniref:Dihydrolipoamide acetyltransferase component of pyruvate dehydrogenase complex n=1 Tax=Peribacillus cavernae TaxID=1674310 RepID=A0A433HS58_9BACI|nr:dihydrolipoamide acetyltransferase family protein [Peribacillus cavernae]MDQ0220642.1 pyruvate dehydrogenase E2 component (dihydrolipoamide acetyltransferase) [Peribacillus cavernae]RUQ31102.1 2-oxo acid dehydrogenase subunit E2 [Peribacillus cavernae]